MSRRGRDGSGGGPPAPARRTRTVPAPAAAATARPARTGTGFTLIEVLVVLAILGIASAAVAPQIAALLDPGPRAAAEELAEVYREARQLATTRARLATVTVDPRTGTWRLFAGRAHGVGASAVDGGNLLTDRPGVRIDGGGDLAVVRFDGRGRASGPTLAIVDGARRHRIHVDAWTGSIRIR